MTYYKFTITGIVQGVGFRPYIYNACIKAKLTGTVQNIGSGVEITIDDKDALENILKNIPQLARIDHVTNEKVEAMYTEFTIIDSSGTGFSEIPADLNLCDKCTEELHNPHSRRYNYFFTTCTNCGPRFTIAQKSPYDRHTTTMNEFSMCPQCRGEYTDPSNRRYHAQTIACPDCGPDLILYSGKASITHTPTEAINATCNLLKQGEIVAIKGVGGFHLVCNTDPTTVQKLKDLTNRTDKPFALMCYDLSMVHMIAYTSTEEEKLLQSQERPIVILRKKADLPEISELDSVGVMLPYTALHELLFTKYNQPLVMTSSNLSGSPISTTREEQIVDYVLNHTRDISNSADDSLIKVVDEQPLLIRRSRGYVPRSLATSHNSTQQILALGAEMNSTFAIYKDGRITPSQYLGNTGKYKTFEHYKKTLEKFLSYTNTKPDILLADLHPNYNTSLYAKELSQKWNIPLHRIQHHKAHAASVALEYNLTQSTAIVCDGMGYGQDNTIWGGEVFADDKRVGHLEQHKLLGGDTATHDPRKMLFSILKNFMSSEDIAAFFDKHNIQTFSDKTLSLLDKQWDENFNTPLTSSCGRILDATAVLLGLCETNTYDGRAPMLLEACAEGAKPYTFDPIIENNILLTTPLFTFLVEHKHKDAERLAATALIYIAQGLHTIAKQYNNPITFSGGCAYNSIMSTYMLEHDVLMNKKIPPGDGGISYGQIAYYLQHFDN